MEDKLFSPVPGNGVEVRNYPDNYDDENRRGSTVMLYDEFEGAIGKTKCNSETRSDRNLKSRVFKQGIRFFVDNLKVRIRGRIGGRPFTATKDYGCYGDAYGKNQRISVNPVEITKRDTLGNGEGCGNDVGLNFTPVNLYGRVGVPNDGRRVRGNIKLDHCLSVECVETTERYGDYEEGYIRATVGYSFLVTHNIIHTTSEEIAVFTNPNGIECRNAARDSSCRSEERYRRNRRHGNRRDDDRCDDDRRYDNRRDDDRCDDDRRCDNRRDDDRCDDDRRYDNRRDNDRCDDDIRYDNRRDDDRCDDDIRYDNRRDDDRCDDDRRNNNRCDNDRCNDRCNNEY